MCSSKDFIETTPENIEELKKQAKNKTDYKIRLQTVEILGKHKCRQSIDVLWHLMMNDKIHSVQHAAFLKLQAFGENVKLPRKKKGKPVKDINKKIKKIRNTFGADFSIPEFKEEFKRRYPEEYDIYSYEKRNNFDKWLTNVVTTLPKK